MTHNDDLLREMVKELRQRAEKLAQKELDAMGMPSMGVGVAESFRGGKNACIAQADALEALLRDVKLRCEKCGHVWGAYEDTCHCLGPCYNTGGCPTGRIATLERELREARAPRTVNNTDTAALIVACEKEAARIDVEQGGDADWQPGAWLNLVAHQLREQDAEIARLQEVNTRLHQQIDKCEYCQTIARLQSVIDQMKAWLTSMSREDTYGILGRSDAPLSLGEKSGLRIALAHLDTLTRQDGSR